LGGPDSQYQVLRSESSMILILILAAAIAEPVNPAYAKLCAALDV
jgi:hypothetical protein